MSRDDFNQQTKTTISCRASWQCSFTGCEPRILVGPSDESGRSVNNVGIVAHISGAASGPGSRRYNSAMKSAERRSEANGIFMCAVHATMIDRDDVSFTADQLLEMKAAHEQKCKTQLHTGTGLNIGAGLIAIGPNVVCTGDLTHIEAERWTLQLKHFVVGDFHALVSYVDGFATAEASTRYILSNELGDGRTLTAAPVLAKASQGYKLLCTVAPRAPRIEVRRLGNSLAEHPASGDVYLDKNRSIARVSGLDFLPQMVKSVLSFQKGESPFHPDAGMRFFEYFEAYKGSPWISQLLQLDVTRQASIPYCDPITRQSATPLRCVTRVRGIELLWDFPQDNRLSVRLDLDVEGVGPWQHETKIYMPTKEQMDERAQMIADIPWLTATVDRGHVEPIPCPDLPGLKDIF